MERIIQNIFRFFLSALIIISLHSCERDKAKDALNEVEIINSLFDSLFQVKKRHDRIHKYYMENTGINPFSDPETARKEFQKLIDTVTWIAVTSDTLEKLDVKGDRGSYIFEALEQSDSLYRKFINKASEHIFKARYIPENSFYDDRIIYLRDNELPEKKRLHEWIDVLNDTLLVASYSMTRIAFNDTHDLGIFSFKSSLPYSRCGYEHIEYILIKRINKKWTIHKRIRKTY